MFDEIAKDIALRQYAQPHETEVEQIFKRAATVIDAAPSIYNDKGFLSDLVYQAMLDKRFCPGGRILAGAGTSHGNLLNCFVQDGHPWPDKTDDLTEYALNMAKKLALVTKVGGGNGVNLDPFPPKREFTERTQPIYLTYNDENVRRGRFLDLVTGKRVTRGYRALTLLDPGEIIEVESPDSVEVIHVPDDTAGIWDAAAKMVRDFLAGKVVIIDVSALRPEGSTVRGSGGTSSGPASFAVEVFDNFAKWAKLGGGDYAGPVATLRYLLAPTLRVIRQGGVRRGAGMATLSAEHPDIQDFITCKDLKRERQEGDISTFNISVLVTRDFMRYAVRHAVPSTPESSTLDAIAQHAWETGEPGLLYVDTINENNLLYEEEGPIVATNPCGEVTLYPGEPCDLGAINVSAYFKMGWEYNSHEWHTAIQMIRKDAFAFAEYLDLILDVEKAPLPEITHAISTKRRIGLGMMGLGDALIKLGVAYGSSASFEIAGDIARAIRDGALEYTYNAEPTPGLKNRRNVALLTVAPTGTTAMVMGTTSGIEPLFAPFVYRRVGTEYKQILHPLFKEMMELYKPGPYFCTWKEIGDGAYTPDQWDWRAITKAISENHGSVQGIVGIPEEVRDVFVCAHDITPKHHVYMQSAVQYAFDYEEVDGVDVPTFAGNSISKTINLPKDATVQDVRKIYELGWMHELKGITVYRDGSRDLQVLNTTMEDDGTTASSQAADDQLQEIVAATCALDGTCDT